MNDALKMQISAFVDGELPDNESELLLRRLSHDVDLRQQVARYLEIGRFMRREADIPGMSRLRKGVAESLGEDVYVAESVEPPAENRLVKPLAGMAIAATVAMLAIFSLQQVGDPVDAGLVNVADGGVSTPPVAESDAILDEMFRRHENAFGGGGIGIIGEFVDLEINEEGLVRIEPKAQLIPTVGYESDVDPLENDIADDAAEPAAE